MTKSIEDILNKKKQAISDKRMGNKNPYKFKNGITTIRILPGWRKDDPTFYHSFGQSFIKDMDNKVLAVIGAKNITYGEDDLVQNMLQQAKNLSSTDAQRKHWDDARAKPRELVNALILDDKEVDPNVPEIVNFSETQLEQIIDQVQMNDIVKEFLDLDNGFNLKVSKSGTGFTTKYTFSFERKATPVNKSVMDSINDLDAYVRSQMTGTDQAINAIKAITSGSEVLGLEDKSTSYSGDDSIITADYSVVNESDDDLPWENENTKDMPDIESLFADDDGGE